MLPLNSKIRSSRSHWLGGCALALMLAVIAADPAAAQTAQSSTGKGHSIQDDESDDQATGIADGSTEGADIIVSGSRIDRPWFAAPSPLTRLSAAEVTHLSFRIPTTRGPQLEVHANVSNLFDKDPPIASLYSPFYDVVGRFMTTGVRVKF